jgi:hypothetical protein
MNEGEGGEAVYIIIGVTANSKAEVAYVVGTPPNPYHSPTRFTR